MITLLTLLCVFLAMFHLRVRSHSISPAPDHPGIYGRVAEVVALGQKLGKAPASTGLAKGAMGGRLSDLKARMVDPWDRALFSVLLAETGDPINAKPMALDGPLPPGPGLAFRAGWRWAYEDSGQNSGGTME